MQWNNTDVNNYATSTIHKYLNETYYNTLPVQDREKLGTKAVQEEFHGQKYPEGPYKQLYGWISMNVSVWLPSLSELIGYDPNHYYDPSGVYFSAMQGLNASSSYWTDSKGGNQFTYFQQFNASGGGTVIMNACNQQVTWLRSPGAGHPNWAAAVRALDTLDLADVVALSYAVHPAVLYNPERPVKQVGLLHKV